MDDGITVTGLGEASAPADVVRISVGVQSSAADVSGALSDAGARLAALTAAARDHGVRDADIQSSAAGVQPRYGDDGIAVVGYQAHHQLEVTAREIERAGDLIAAFAGAAGNALTVNQITLTIDDPAPLQVLAREAAFASARDKAEQFARLAGRGLADVLAVSETPDQTHGFLAFSGGREAQMASSMPIEPGETSVRASVTVRWSLGPARSV